jgi:hypothetical protein
VTAQEREDADRLAAVTARAQEARNGLYGLLAGSSTGNTSTIQINAGGFGVWIASSACAVMLAVNLFTIALYLDQQAQIRQLNEYLTATYMLCPALKPENYGK